MSLSLRVHVLDESGAPLSGATVRAGEANTAVTDADGIATIDGIEPGWTSVAVSHAMPAVATLGLSLEDGSCGVIERTVTLRRGAPLGGRVLSPDGVPLPDALVEVWCDEHRTLYLETDANGTWLAPAMQPGEFEVRASADGYARGRAVTGTHGGRTARLDVDVRTARGARLCGVVRDATGVPVADARIYTEMQPGDDRHGTTDAAGRFDIQGLGAGRHHVSVAGGRWRSSVVMPADGEELELDVTLPAEAAAATATSCAPSRERSAAPAPTPTATLIGRVLRDGAPVSRFAILRRGNAAYRWIAGPAMIHTPDGRFTLSDLRQPSCSVHVLALGSAWANTDTVILPPGETVDLGDIALVPGVRITGTVHDSRGAAVGGATVTVGSRAHSDHGPLADAVDGYFEATTDARGAFAIEGVHLRHRNTRIRAQHPLHGVSLEQPIAVRGRRDRIRRKPFLLTLQPTGAIDGEIEAIAHNASVIVRGDRPELGSRVISVRPSGRFAVEGLPPGDYTIELAERPSWPQREAVVTVVAGQRARVRMPPP